MRTTMIIAALLLMNHFMNGQAFKTDFVVTDKDTVFCENLRVGNAKAICRTMDGEKLSFKTGDLIKYARDGRMWEKMPVYTNNEATGKSEMMELVAYRNNIAVYRHKKFNPVSSTIDAYFYLYSKDNCITLQKNPGIQELRALVNEVYKEGFEAAKAQLTSVR